MTSSGIISLVGMAYYWYLSVKGCTLHLFSTTPVKHFHKIVGSYFKLMFLSILPKAKYLLFMFYCFTVAK
jgi:hypothetical protein